VTRRYLSIYEALQHRHPDLSLVAEPTTSIS
jgi:hypothetical protein